MAISDCTAMIEAWDIVIYSAPPAAHSSSPCFLSDAFRLLQDTMQKHHHDFSPHSGQNGERREFHTYIPIRRKEVDCNRCYKQLIAFTPPLSLHERYLLAQVFRNSKPYQATGPTAYEVQQVVHPLLRNQ